MFKSFQQFHFTVSYIIYLSKTIDTENKEVRAEQKVSFCKKLTNLCPNLFCTLHYLYALFISPTKRCKKVFSNEMMIDAMNAIRKPSISNADPITFAPNNNVIVLITKMKKPNVKIVSGNVKIINNGLTNAFSIDKTILANNAVWKFSI